MVEITACCSHLSPYAIWCTITHFHLKIRINQAVTDLIDRTNKGINICHALLLFLRQLCLYLSILAGTAIAEREVLQFALDMIQSQSISQRSIEIVRLTCNLHLLVRAHTVKRSHIMQTVSQLDEDGTHIILHRGEDLTVVGHLLRLH